MPAGRPPELDKVVHVRPNGQEVTAAEQVLERVRLGLDFQGAADSAAISRSTLSRWRQLGARARLDAVNGKTLSANEQRYLQFSDDLERAEAEAELQRLAVIDRATLPQTHTKVVEKTEPVLDANGQQARNPDGSLQWRVVERTTTTETRPGQWTAAAWWLERRHPGKYARIDRHEHSGPEGGPIPMSERAAQLADSLREFQATAAATN